LWRALGTCLAGAATSGLGRPEEGLRQIDEGIEQYQGLRTPPVFWPMIRWMQAQALVEAGTPGSGFAYIDEAIALAGADGVLSPLFHIVRGDLSRLGANADAAAAIASYERAYAVSEGFGERMTQLRAAVRLARLAPAPDQSRTDALRDVYDRFSEGLQTPDLTEAAATVG
jgi:hypothetical protein